MGRGGVSEKESGSGSGKEGVSEKGRSEWEREG